MPAASVQIDGPALRKLLGGPDGPVAKVILRTRVRRVRKVADTLCPVDTGELRRSIYGKVVSAGPRLYGEVGATADHALYQEQGTGIHGPFRRPIIAKPGKVFVFRSRTTGELVFTRKTKGVPATHFLERSLNAVR